LANTIFNIIASNTTNRVYNIIDDIGDVICYYNDTKIHLIFNPTFNDNGDGCHIIDIFDISLNSKKYGQAHVVTYPVIRMRVLVPYSLS
jgi:hypothetical protein